MTSLLDQNEYIFHTILESWLIRITVVSLPTKSLTTNVVSTLSGVSTTKFNA